MSNLRDQIAKALTAEHYRRAQEQIEASPEEHQAAFADVVMAVVRAELDKRDAEIGRLREQVSARHQTAVRANRVLNTALDDSVALAERAEKAEAERDQLRKAVGHLLVAEGRLLDGWAEASPDHRAELWRKLHEAADDVREVLESS